MSLVVLRRAPWRGYRPAASFLAPLVPARFCSTAAPSSPTAAASTAADGSATAPPAGAQADAEAPKMHYRARWRYTAPFRTKSLLDFMFCDQDRVTAIAHTYKHEEDDITVTLIPLRHFAHPLFFKQVDDLCCQHQSVLMEGRVPLQGAPFSTFVPPRDRIKQVRPEDNEDDEGWEPREVERFFQPFSWGVTDSPNFTVVHAADKYDYERLPWWCSVRFNVPVLGSLAREQHCLNMLHPLRANGYTSFAVPWGAAHMPIFHEMLLDNGFTPVGMCSLLVLQKIDGTISEGEYASMLRTQRRRGRRGLYLQIVGALLVLAYCYSSLRVERHSGPGQ